MPGIKERPSRKVYPVGYSMSGALQYVDRLMAQPQMLLIDTRFSPKSWSVDWRKESLREKYGNRYRLAGAYLGNLNFQGGPIELADPDTGIQGLCRYLEEGYDLILLCQCQDYHRCHRKVIVDLLLQQISVEVVQLGPAAAGAETIMALSIKQPYAHWLSHPGMFLSAGIRPKTIENRDWTKKTLLTNSTLSCTVKASSPMHWWGIVIAPIFVVGLFVESDNMSNYWFAVRPLETPHQHPFLVFDRQDQLHFHLTVFAKSAMDAMAASTVRTYLYALLPFFTFLDEDEWQQRAGVQWDSPPEQVRRAVNDYLIQRLRCKVREHRQGFQMVGQTEEMRSSTRIFLSALKLFYHIMRQRNSYLFPNPLVDGMATALAEVDRAVKTEPELPRMPEKSGVVSPGHARRLTDSYFKLEREEWVPQVVDDPLFPTHVFAGGQKCGWKLREICITLLLFETGARVSEVVGLTLGDWVARGTLQEVNAMSKGSRGRRVKFLRFHADTSVLLRRYVDTERRAIDPHHRTLHDYSEMGRNHQIDLRTIPLFLSSQRTSLSAKTYREHAWNPACKAAGIDADVHQTRQCAA